MGEVPGVGLGACLQPLILSQPQQFEGRAVIPLFQMEKLRLEEEKPGGRGETLSSVPGPGDHRSET